MLSLRDPLYKKPLAVCAPAARPPERIEAAAFLGVLLHEIRAQDPKLNKRLDAMIHRALSDN